MLPMVRALLFPLLLFLLAVLAVTPVRACFNDYEPNVAAIQRSQALLVQLRHHDEKEPWTARRDRLRKALAAGGDYRVKNDLATALAHTGAAAEAVTLLQEIEAEKPGLYMTASNLGTAYELSGDDTHALEWIREGIQRNAASHKGTEWLHVRILEAKLALHDDPQWLESHSVLGPRNKQGEVTISVTGNRSEPLPNDLIKAALIYQLHERLEFVEPPDAIVGDLLFELGKLVSREKSSGVGGAMGVYELAFGYLKNLPGSESLQQMVDANVGYAGMQQRKPRLGFYLPDFALLCILGIVLSLPVIAAMRWLKRRNAAAGLWSPISPKKERLN